jgi:MFS family permease
VIPLLAALYVVQGLPFGFQATALPIYLREQGQSLAVIGYTGLLALPWSLKLLLAPLVDRYGTRRAWIIPLQLLLAGACAAAALAGPEPGMPLFWLLVAVFFMNLFAATQDIAVDGLAVDLLRGANQLGVGNAAQVVGYKIGMLTGGGLLLAASATIGWRGLFLTMGAIVLAVAALAATTIREPPRTTPRVPTLRELLRALAAAMRAPGTGWLLLFIATYKLGETATNRAWGTFLYDHGFSKQQLGLWLGTWGMGASIVGSLAGGLAATRLPLERLLLSTLAVRGLSLAALAAVAAAGPTPAGVIAVTMSEDFFGGALTTVTFATMMARVDPRIGATHFTLLATVEVLGKMPPAVFAPVLAGWVGYLPVFVGSALLSIALIAVVPPLTRVARG